MHVCIWPIYMIYYVVVMKFAFLKRENRRAGSTVSGA